jgi:ribosomal protein S18 acetylase RimI-like enzyme
MDVRAAAEPELDQLAKVWYDAWQDAHARILPAALARYRTLESFRDRLHAGLSRVRVTGPSHRPTGFCMIKDDELYQLFVAAEARGSGVAAALLADGEARLAASGVETAFLVCAIGNERAARFYEKHGWLRVGTFTSEAETPDGPFLLDAWRYEKRVRTSGSVT